MGLSSVTTSNPRPCKGAILGVQFNADIAAVKAFALQARWCRFQRTGLSQTPPFRTARKYARFPRASGDRRPKCPALVRYGIDKPNVPLVSCGRHKGVVIIAAAAGLIDTLYLALSWYFLGVFVSCAAPLPVARSRSRRDRLCNGGSVIVIFL